MAVNKIIFQDFKQDEDDIFIHPSSGDFIIHASDEDHIIDIMQSFEGEYKENPSVGVGIGAYLNSSGQEQKISRSVSLQLEADEFTVKSPNFKMDASGKLIVAPHAVRS